jgi:hypothetical protein
MDRGDYYEAKAAILNCQVEEANARLRIALASGRRDRVLLKFGIEPNVPAFSFNDETLTIEPVTTAGG